MLTSMQYRQQTIKVTLKAAGNLMNISRRTLGCISTAAILAAAGVAACSTSTTTASQVATDVSLIASGLSSAITAIAAIPGVPATIVTQLQGYLATIKTDAEQVATATATASADANIVQEIASTVQTVADIALPLIPGGSAIVLIINAAISLLPTILAVVGVTSATRMLPVYTPDQARLILRAAMVK